MPVTVSLKGRCGNQCFQIATCISYALKHGIDYIIPEHTLNDSVWPPYFKHLHYPHKHSGVVIPIKEESHAYKELPFEPNWAGHVIELDGYFQSELYFKDFAQEIKLLLKAPSPHKWKKNACSIHLRFGDYLHLKDKHPPVTSDYIEMAIRKIFTLADIKHFEIYSDDMARAQKEVMRVLDNPILPSLEVDFITHNEPILDLYSMASCNYNIIANSTFSWWASWLNRQPDKIVITPHEDNWFGPGNSNLSTATLLPKEWIRIKY